MGEVLLKNIRKVYGNKEVLKDITLKINKGEFFTFLGPSGCGKTTLLRIIAGLESHQKGKVYLKGEDISHLSAEKRKVGMVFQNYALFPNMTVFENIAYGLKLKGLNKEKIKNKVQSYLNLVNLSGYDNRNITQLSGGEQQRVALARSVITEPEVLLLDEPLSNLDARLRDKMRLEIKELQKKLGITTIFVTHDQSEALSMSDKIAIFNKGNCMQVGDPVDIYKNPKNSFVAQFVGETNLYNVNISNNDAIINENIILKLKDGKKGNHISIRPQDIMIYKTKKSLVNEFKVNIVHIQFNGATIEYICKLNNLEIKIWVLNNTFNHNAFNTKEDVFIHLPKESINVL
ncbi:MAG: ABC transporter ATP-binding protein [Firmicutes bacterium]|nr:ABC transporter ATP-binding protein [Bacillota bacterium]